MKLDFFKKSARGTAVTIAFLTVTFSPMNAPAQTPPDAPPPPDNTATTPNQLPPNIYPTSPLAQVIRLSQAGVDQSIILTYVTNSGSTFNLDSDKIIYLKDIGLPAEVVTAMIQRDQQLQQQIAAATPPPPPPATTPPATDTTPETAPAPPPEEEPEPPVTVNYFYGTLAPYGTWVDVDGYGHCWRPSVCIYNPHWQPYCDHGHWVYTDCGWYWFSDYSWGWAPFHYGRWFQHPRWGWCWTPDTVWGPSWVTWRYSDNYCGWAPLPPFATYQAGVGFFYHGTAVSFGFNWGLSPACFTFVPTQFFCDPHPRQHCVEPARLTQVFSQTTVINNFNAHGRTVFNGGIAPEHITAVTHNPIRPVAIRHANVPFEPGRGGDQLSHDGAILVVSRPGPLGVPAGGNRNYHLPPSGNPGSNRPLPPNNNWPSSPDRHNPPAPGQNTITRDPQPGGSDRVPAQHPWPGANPAPQQNDNRSRTDSPRGWQTHPTPPAPSEPRNSGAPNAGQSGGSVPVQHNAPAPARPQNNQPQPHSEPAPAAPASGQNQNQFQNGSGNGSANNSGSGPRH